MVIQISSSAQKLSSLGSPQADLFESPWGLILDRLFCFRVMDAQDWLFFCVFIRGIHPVCGEPLFCFSANPDSLSELCGFHIDHRSRSFLLQVSGVSSHLSFCCTSLVSGFIILKTGPLVYSQTVQQLSLVFAPKVQKAGIHETRPKLSGRLCPVMSLIATVLFKEPSFGTWVHTFGCNFPMALCWQMFYCGPLSRAIFRLLFRRGEKK